MEIAPRVRILDLALLLEEHATLVFGDVHLGYEKELNAQGIMLPKFHFQDIVTRLTPILETAKPKSIILNGDIKHEFGTISDEEWRQVVRLLDLLTRYAPVTFIKGNHDTILAPIAAHTKVILTDHALLGDIFVCHGDVLFDSHPDFKRAATMVIGHEHPALGLSDGVRTERYKCYLKGERKNRGLIVMPSFAQLHEGTDVLRERLLSPYLSGADVTKFEAWVVRPDLPTKDSLDTDGNSLAFGRIGKLLG